MLVEFSLKRLYSTIFKSFQIYGVHILRKYILTHSPLQSTLAPTFLSLCPRRYSFPKAAFFRKFVSFNSRKGWRKLWFALSKFSQKIWRWLGTLRFLYFVWFTIFSNAIYSMVLILLLLLWNHGKLILKLHQKKISYLDEACLFTSSFKVESISGMIHKEVLAQFIYKHV